MPRYVTRRVIAEVLQAHPMTVHYWSKSQDFPAPLAVIGRTFLYSPNDIYTWLNQHDKATPQQIRELRSQEVAA